MPALLYQIRGKSLNGPSLFSTRRCRLQQVVDRRRERLGAGDSGRKLDPGDGALATQIEPFGVDPGEAPALRAASRRQLRQPVGMVAQLLDQAVLRLRECGSGGEGDVGRLDP